MYSYASIQTTAHIKNNTVVFGYPQCVWEGATAIVGLEHRHLMLTTCGIVHIIQSSIHRYSQHTRDLEYVGTLTANLDPTPKLTCLENDALPVLATLCQIDVNVLHRTEAFSQDAYKRACNRDNTRVVTLPFVDYYLRLSATGSYGELTQITTRTIHLAMRSFIQ